MIQPGESSRCSWQDRRTTFTTASRPCRVRLMRMHRSEAELAGCRSWAFDRGTLFDRFSSRSPHNRALEPPRAGKELVVDLRGSRTPRCAGQSSEHKGLTGRDSQLVHQLRTDPALRQAPVLTPLPVQHHADAADSRRGHRVWWMGAGVHAVLRQDRRQARPPKLSPTIDNARPKAKVLAFTASSARTGARSGGYPPRADQHGDETPQPRRMHLPQRRGRQSGRGPARHARRVERRRPPLHLRRFHDQASRRKARLGKAQPEDGE